MGLLGLGEPGFSSLASKEVAFDRKGTKYKMRNYENRHVGFTFFFFLLKM